MYECQLRCLSRQRGMQNCLGGNSRWHERRRKEGMKKRKKKKRRRKEGMKKRKKWKRRRKK